MNYLIVCHTNNQYYLLLVQNKEGYNIRAFDSKDAVLKAFGGYVDAFKGDITWRASATIGMMQMNPIAIKAPDDVNELSKYVIEMKPIHISGGAIGRGFDGVAVKEDILELKQFDLFKELLILADN